MTHDETITLDEASKDRDCPVSTSTPAAYVVYWLASDGQSGVWYGTVATADGAYEDAVMTAKRDVDHNIEEDGEIIIYLVVDEHKV